MFTSLQTRLKKAGSWLPVALLPLLPFAAQAQGLNYQPANAVNTTGTYTDLGTSGTVIATSSTDDANSAALPLGFTLNFNGTAFTQFVLNTNGYVKLGGAAPSAATQLNPIGSADPLDINIVAPLSNIDLQTAAAATAEYRVFTSAGAVGSRVTTIQWKNVADKLSTSAPAQFASMQFQVKFYETTNQIEFVYGTWVAGTGAPTGQPFLVGLKGTTNGLADRLLGSKTSSATAWTTTTFTPGTVATTLPAHFVRNTFPPDAGRTYRFVPTLGNDAAVVTIQTLGTVSSTYGSPVTVKAVVRNSGTSVQTALPVTLTVAGATTFTNTQTVATLAAGATTTVTFTAYPVTTAGVNTLTVGIPADDNTANNSLPYSQTVTAASQGYVDTTQPFAAIAVGVGSANGILTARYNSSSAAAVTTITPTFQGAGTAGTTYQVLVYGSNAGVPGTLLYTSPTLTRPATSGPVATAVPSIPVNGDFFVGVKELDNNLALANQVEDPLRTGAFFFTVTNGTTWTDVSTTALKTRLALDITLAAPAACGVATGLAATSVTTTGATVTFTAPAGATSYTVTYTPTGGTATTVTPAPTASPVTLSGLLSGTTYTVSVTTNCGAGQTSGSVTTTFTTLPVAPANDNCATATALPVGATCTNTLGTTAGATASTAPVPAPSCGGAAVGPLLDVWYSLVVPANGSVVVSTSAATGSTLNDTALELYSGTCGALISVGCNDDFGGTNFSTVSVSGQTAGATLYARVRSYGNTPTGTFNICATTIACTPVTSLATTSITTTGATVTFTAPAGATGYTVTYTPTGGTATTVTPAPTASPVVLTGLTPSTSYTVSVTTNCSAGQTSTATTTTFTTLPTPAPYATLPYAESFEGPWINGQGTRDLPSASWRNTPATGTNSWRRDDDGASAGWIFTTDGIYSPVASQGARSARFHSSWAVSGLVGSLDLYVNLSGAIGARTLTFDYVNPTGSTSNPSDKLDVLVSTDGGVTFSATPVLTAVTNATFTAKTVVIPSTSATTVIRFRALADFGNDDIGIDNVQLRVITATKNAALAATVNLYPNPAHQGFQLSVPAGLRNASASLTNALGQVVQSRELNLPAAGGIVPFDVSRLAAGVYSLTLKSGNDLVVKRVVVD